MPTKPPSTLFDPELAKAQVRPILDLAIPLLREVLNHGLALFARCSIRPEGGDENLVILLVYRHLLELLDAVMIQVAECAPSPAALQLRAMFEALLTIEYLTQDGSKTRSRALAYLYQVEIQRKRFYLSQDPNSVGGKEFQRSIADDPYSRDWKPLNSEDVAGRVKEIDAMLDKEEYKEIAAERHSTKKQIKRYPAWHSLYGGPKNIEELARRLKRAASYQILYREWSERSHSVDAIDRILTHDSSGPAARSLRDPTELEATIDFSITFAMDAARCLIRYYRPDEERAFAKWYGHEISASWKRLPKIGVRKQSGGSRSGSAG
jgi:hypothetical protein